jgi:hypothetical protein
MEASYKDVAYKYDALLQQKLQKAKKREQRKVKDSSIFWLIYWTLKGDSIATL